LKEGRGVALILLWSDSVASVPVARMAYVAGERPRCRTRYTEGTERPVGTAERLSRRYHRRYRISLRGWWSQWFR